MGAYAKEIAKRSAGIYASVALFQIGSQIKRNSRAMKEQQQQQQQQAPVTATRYEYGLYEETIVRVMGALSSLMEAVLKNDVEVDSYVMKEAKEIMNGFQDLLDAKKKYETEKGSK